MQKIKTKNKPAAKKAATKKLKPRASAKEILSKVTKIETMEEKALRRDLYYYKGMAIFITCMMLCIFIAFGALFSLMYLETKMMRISMENSLSEMMFQIENCNQ
ncbi:hypothetical protein KKC32_01205 [Patescibacteria group bacterium]|nr:hypothetical protein [Patescibacteria group bacterium]